MSSTILLIEDDQEIRETLRDVLELEGYNVELSINGKEVLGKLESLKPNLVLLDLNMPVMDGMEFLKHREGDSKLKQIPVIVLTATGETRREEAAKLASHVLKKPIDLNNMLETLTRFT